MSLSSVNPASRIIFSKVIDADTRSHVEQVDLSAFPHGRRFQNQLAGFRNRHEVARDVRMGNRYRSAGFDLFTEAWNYRAVRIGTFPKRVVMNRVAETVPND